MEPPVEQATAAPGEKRMWWRCKVCGERFRSRKRAEAHAETHDDN